MLPVLQQSNFPINIANLGKGGGTVVNSGHGTRTNFKDL